MENLRPNEQRAKTAILLIWIVLGLEIASFISSYFQYNLLETANNGGQVSFESVTVNDIREQTIAIIYLIASAVSGIVFIQWFRRAYYNLHLKVNHLTFSEGWAAGSWFVPILNLFRPFRIMKELFEETERLLFKRDPEVKAKLTTKILGFWWALWLISHYIDQYIFRSNLKADTIKEIMLITKINMVSNIIGIPLALITIKIIKNYSSVEKLLSEPEEEVEPIDEVKIDTAEIV